MCTSLEPRLSVPDFVSQLCPKLQDEIQNGKPGFEAKCALGRSTWRSVIKHVKHGR